MNELFINKLKTSGTSAYRLSKSSGVPYTTISELMTCKKAINKRAAETVFRLAAALGCKPEDILDPVYVMDGVSGKYKGVAYTWREDNGHMDLLLDYQGKKTEVCLPYKLQNFGQRDIYDAMTKLYIEPFLREIEFAAQYAKLIEKEKG